MHKKTYTLLAAALMCGTARADETAAKGSIVSLGLFKNGLAVVRAEVTVPGAGTYRLDNAPDPVHGTFWVQSDAAVEATVKAREGEVPAGQAALGNLQTELAGKRVVVHFRGEKLPPVAGTVQEIKSDRRSEPWRRPLPPPYGSPDAVWQPSRFLVLTTPRGRAYLDMGEIAYVEAPGAEGTVKQRKPVLVFTVGGDGKQETKLTVTYLTRGIAWAPSYRMDISDSKTLLLEQSAVVRNELTDLRDCDIQLISGFPSVQFSHVTSPLSPHATWAAFFQELSQRSPTEHAALGNRVMLQQAVMNNPVDASFGGAIGAIPTGEGVDLHYQPIGKRTLAEGDALSLNVARGKAEYQRVVEWLIPDTRNEFGQYARRERGEEEDDNDAAWDALRFKNPLAFPMTTGPAMVVADGRFNGQRMSRWVNAGEETTLRVNKALSVRTRAVEHEEPQKEAEDGRSIIYIGGQRYRKSLVAGELAVNNHRKEAITLVIRRRFSGDLLNAEGSPKSSLREEGVYSVNKRNELLWTLTLKPGEEKKLAYRYSVLVSF